MKRNHFLLALFAIVLLLNSCEKDAIIDDASINQSSVINGIAVGSKSGERDGVSYSLKDVVLNSGLISINENSVLLKSTPEELTSGIIKLSDVSEEIASSLSEGKILYIKMGNYTGLRKINSVTVQNLNVYKMETSQAQLGEVFEEGVLNVSVDLREASLARQATGALRSSGIGYSHEILDLQDEYDLGNGLKYNPATNIKMVYNMRLTFSRGQILPSEFTNIFEIQLSVNPEFNFQSSYNKISVSEISGYIPPVVLEYIKSQEFDIDIPINVLGIETLPAKITIEDIKIPLEIEANISQQSKIGFGINGNFKIGYKININGLKATTTPIYENNIVTSNPSTSEIYGELLTDGKIVITPNISFLDNAYNVTGEIVFGNKTTTYGNINLPNQAPVFGSQGVNTSKMTAIVDLLLIKVPVTVVNTEEQLWNFGTIVKSVTYSDLRYALSSSYTDGSNLLTWGINRAHNVEFTLNYKYPIIGKKIPNELIISYDVYEENGSSKITSVKDLVIVPTDVTANSFKFKQNIPFRGTTTIIYKTVLGIKIPVGTETTYQTKSQIKNIVIKDNKGYVYEGIYNTAKGIVENSFVISR